MNRGERRTVQAIETLCNIIDILRELNEAGVTEIANEVDEKIAFDYEEVFKGLQCIVAPVTNQHEELIGAVSVTEPISRMQEPRLNDEIASMV